jgi:serine phosphatase RsbU (regulator of sigma subunit)
MCFRLIGAGSPTLPMSPAMVLPPGVVMGMVKSAARMQLSSTEESAALLEHLNSVLIPIKKPEMFVTFAYLAWNGERLQYSLAGHPPILHYHALTRGNFRISMLQSAPGNV